MMRFNLEPSRKEWREVYRLARTPDKYLADPMVLAFPVRWLVIASQCRDSLNQTDSLLIAKTKRLTKWARRKVGV